MVTVGRSSSTAQSEADFAEFFAATEPRLRAALTSRFGHQVGHDATASALAYAWANWARVASMDNPLGYLYRVGQSKARRERRREPATRQPSATAAVEPDVDLQNALDQLTVRQRVSVVLVHGSGWTTAEVGLILRCSASTVQTHARRGLERLRKELSE